MPETATIAPAAPIAPPTGVPVNAPVLVPADAAPVTPATEAPVVPVEAVEPPEPVAPEVAPEVQQYISQLEQRAAEAEVKQDRATLQAFVGNLSKQYEEQYGLPPEAAQKLATQHGNQAHKAWQAEKHRTGQFNAAMEIGLKHKVDPRTLMNLPSPEAMEARAREQAAGNVTAQQIAALQAENAALRKRLAPAQTFANGIVSGDGTTATKDNIDALYLKDSARYGETYRKFLRTGQI